MSLKRIAAALREKNNFLISCHTSPEGDALGAELALSIALKKMGKRVLIVNDDPVPPEYSFMPGVENILRYRPKGPEFDCFVVVDCSDLKRTGEVYRLIDTQPVINIDHHISNDKFGSINWVEPHSSSTCEMIWHLYKRLSIPIDKDAAVCLYAGIMSDTGSFRYANTTVAAHVAAADLIRRGASVTQAYRGIYENIPCRDAKFLARVLSDMHCEEKGKVIWFQLKHDALKNKKLSFDLSEELLSFGRAVKGAEVALLFKENLGEKNEVRINFRSQGKVDVNAIAAFFGGGGHKNASGATVHGKINVIRKKVLAKVRQALR